MINFARDGAADDLLVAARALSDCARAVVNEKARRTTYALNNLPPGVATWVLRHFDEEVLDDTLVLLENKSLISSIHTHWLHKGNQVARGIAHRKGSIVGNKRSFDGKHKEVQIMCYIYRSQVTYRMDSKPGFDSSSSKYQVSRRSCPICSPLINHKSHSMRRLPRKYIPVDSSVQWISIDSVYTNTYLKTKGVSAPRRPTLPTTHDSELVGKRAKKKPSVSCSTLIAPS